jgi:hypothetical protein
MKASIAVVATSTRGGPAAAGLDELEGFERFERFDWDVDRDSIVGEDA